MKELLKQKKVQYGIGGAIIILILIIIFVISQMNQVKVDFKLKENVIEYGSDPSKIEWEKLSETNGNKITVKEFDTKKVGQTDIVFTVCLDDTCKEFTEQVEIKDTKNPDIKFKKEKLEITEGDKFDPVSNIESVKDPIDGDIKKSDDKELTKDGYIITSDVKVDKAGEYTVKITAYDVNGNKAEQSYKVIVKEKPKEPVSNENTNVSSNTNNQNTHPSNNTEKPVDKPSKPSPKGISAVINTASSFVGRTDMTCADVVIQAYSQNGYDVPYQSAYYLGSSIGTDSSILQPGDLLFVNDNSHVMLVTGVSGNTITVVEGGMNGTNVIASQHVVSNSQLYYGGVGGATIISQIRRVK